MAIGKAMEFLEQLRTDPRAKALFQDQVAAENEKEKLEAYVGIAKEWGYNLTADDLAASLREQIEARRERTEAQTETIQKLDDDEAAGAAGGQQYASNGDMCIGTHEDCDYTFRNRENCWATDGCDILAIHYDDYACYREMKYNSCKLQKMLGCDHYF